MAPRRARDAQSHPCPHPRPNKRLPCRFWCTGRPLKLDTKKQVRRPQDIRAAANWRATSKARTLIW
jgi:hypothetical protein